jgi:Icc-related predicted phosphoesterase
MKTTLISDTHGFHNQLQLEGGDLLIHAGDITTRGSKLEVIQFLEWFKIQKYTHKIVVAGNHDWFFERATAKEIKAIMPKEVIYLNDSGICIDGFTIWGSPIQPVFFDLAFNRERGKGIDKHWQLIPKNTDILITHGPPFGILDQTLRGKNAGCEMLLKKTNEIKPKLHVFGHIHEGYGVMTNDSTTFVNASVLDIRYQYSNLPIHLVLDK